MPDHDHNHHHGHHHDHADAPALLIELREHVPFSVSAVAMGLIAAGVICVLSLGPEQALEAVETAEHLGHDHAEHDHAHSPPQLFFHLFHPAHMLFSALATTAMFCRYEKKVGKAVVIGLVGAIGVCGVSDIAMPHLSLILLGVKTPWHVCVYEHPGLVLPFAVVGVFVGVAASGGVIKSTIISHSLHVTASTMASIFYMVGPLGLVAWIDGLGKIFVFVVLAVMVPCCLSDIVFPLLMSRTAREEYQELPHPH
ncbi:MAG: hypothetical protein PVI86_04330 [Phycisphaerae bacterium]|jgi:hypothetical protein